VNNCLQLQVTINTGTGPARKSGAAPHFICPLLQVQVQFQSTTSVCVFAQRVFIAAMRSNFALSMLLASPQSTIAGPGLTGEGFGPNGTVTCGRDCYVNTFGAGCTDNNTACKCNPDSKLQISLSKCVFDKCPPAPAEISWSNDVFDCNAGNPAALDKLFNQTQGTPVEAFDIPGEYCIFLSSSVVRAAAVRQ
jgi:hypothetical protein